MHNMAILLRKDFKLFQRYLWFVVIYGIAFSTLLQKDGSMLFGLIPGIILMLVNSADMQTSNQQFLVSLPLSRRFLVISKYVSSLTFILFSFVLCLLINGIGDLYRVGQFQWNMEFVAEMLLAMIMVMLVYLPFYYWLAHKGIAILNVAVMAIAMGGNTAVAKLFNNNNVINILKWMTSHQLTIVGLGLFILLLCFVISYRISLLIFMKRDL